jgi:hypothetical protein
VRWQPIETAPRDGRDVLIFIPAVVLERGLVLHHSCVTAAFCTDAEDPNARWSLSWVSGYDWEGPLDDRQPTHWMPLPDPPETPGAGRNA